METSTTRVLTVRQPHAYLLIHGSPNAGTKDVENRPKLTRYRGTLLIQASAKVDRTAYAEYVADGIKLPQAEELRHRCNHRLGPGNWLCPQFALAMGDSRFLALADCPAPSGRSGHPHQGPAIDISRAARLGGLISLTRLDAKD